MLFPRSLTRRQILALSGAASAAAVWTAFQATRLRTKARIVIVGAGSAGLNIAARLSRAIHDPQITLLDPAARHFYQPGFTMIACGVFGPNQVVRPTRALMPSPVRWLQEAVCEFKPSQNRVRTNSGWIPYDFLVLCPGLEMNFAGISGLDPGKLRGPVFSAYDWSSAASFWTALQQLSRKGGRALFTDTWTKIKCGGVPKKVNLMSDAYCRRQGSRDRVSLESWSCQKELFEIDPFRTRLDQIYAERAIPVHFHQRLTAVDPASRKATFNGPDGSESVQDFDLLHVVPPMRAPKPVRESDLAGGKDWVPADRHTLIHPVFPNVLVAGDVAHLPTTAIPPARS